MLLSLDNHAQIILWSSMQNLPLAAWDIICRPNLQGGLGILNLEARNDNLLLKMIHKFLNGHEIPWVQLVWEPLF